MNSKLIRLSIRYIRRPVELSQLELERRVGIALNRISRSEHSVSDFRNGEVQQITAALDEADMHHRQEGNGT